MRKNFLTFSLWVLALTLFVACGYSGNGTQDDPVVAKPMIIGSEDGSRYQCQGIESATYGGNTVLSVFDCEKIKN